MTRSTRCCEACGKIPIPAVTLSVPGRWTSWNTWLCRPVTCSSQFYVAGGRLSCQLYQRSVDSFLGLPFNIASYAILTHMFAEQCDLKPGEFVWTGGDCHIYRNHLNQVREQLQREPGALPRFVIHRKPPSIYEYAYEDFEIVDYYPHAHIRAPIAV